MDQSCRITVQSSSVSWQHLSMHSKWPTIQTRHIGVSLPKKTQSGFSRLSPFLLNLCFNTEHCIISSQIILIAMFSSEHSVSALALLSVPYFLHLSTGSAKMSECLTHGHSFSVDTHRHSIHVYGIEL